MTRQVRSRSMSPNGKSRALLTEKPTETTKKMAKTTTKGENRGDRSMKIKRFGEVAGGTAAECTAVCCCCPCTVMNILVLAIYKMPACICRRARERHRVMKRQQQTLLVHAGRNDLCREELEREVQAVAEKQKPCGGGDDDDGKTEAVDLEKEMWDRFYATGFWRSPSQRST
ncbi:hypothetical protein P3X46_010520 [Hevea brasiliensis]|uniref:Cysteine-rich transmembrane CYSTM domain-containing protein n=1 Tax=Hevea brasiliensis TaxID=3981 RepID=A0ABQ9MFE5_HEVBR|nr:uncharacterized protein LOC110663257 [Hevea brasiliensis]KAJ9178653.1 hypothetical protein P3X46_010520 [Hevea brasiliensis]